MALHVPRAPGFAQMLKEGVKHFSGLDEAVFRNIEACKELADTSRSTYGPFGMNKMVINHLEKLFVTNDSATMLRELEVEHPVARILVMAGNMQEQEIGDGTNLVIIFGGALLAQASELLHAGLSVPEVVSGFERACEKALELLPTLVSYSLNDERDKAEVSRLLSPVLGSKQPGNESLLSQLVALACVSVLTSSGHFNVENICITKILGSSLGESDVVQGLVFKRDVETTVRAVTDAKIAIFSCPIDLANTETKGTVLLSSAAELKAFSRGEESHLDTTFSDLAAAGANVLVSGGKVSDMAIHFANKKGLMVVRLNSKWDLRRLCKAVGATALPMLTIPSPEQLGHCANVSATEIGETQVVMFKQGPNKGAISTILLRGSTENLLDDVERALDDAINTYKVLLKDRRLLPGAGATEMELARELESFGESCPGLQQYGIERFATALLSVPRALAENTGLMATPILARLQAAHQGGQKTAGVDVEGDNDGVCDAVAKGLLDSYLVKQSAIKLATSTATTILQIDQIIMAKKAGGPKPKAKEDWDKDDPTD